MELQNNAEAMIHLQSGAIHIFPSAINRINNPSARVYTEENMTQLIRSTLHKDSYVLTETLPSELSGKFEFVIYGYYVSVNLSNLLPTFEDDTDIHAVVEFNEKNQVHGCDYQENNDYTFTGVTFVSKPENYSMKIKSPSASEFELEGHTMKSLHILTKVGNNWTIPVNSMRCIDGGIV